MKLKIEYIIKVIQVKQELSLVDGMSTNARIFIIHIHLKDNLERNILKLRTQALINIIQG